MGNIAGTTMLNLLFILALTALLRPLAIHLRVLWLELPAYLLSLIAFRAFRAFRALPA